ncbi:MAG: type II toxin-antitoxin system VapC family toxin [Angustibacter sp.]
MAPVTPGRYLLDTHVLLWMLVSPSQLSRRIRGIVADPHQYLFVSAATAWEISTKQRIGKLPQAEVLVQGYHHHLERLGVRSIEISAEHALLAGSLHWSHRDPFDRMIAAQCMIESLVLLTADPAFTSVSGVRCLW